LCKEDDCFGVELDSDNGHPNGGSRRNLPVHRGFGEGRLTTHLRRSDWSAPGLITVGLAADPSQMLVHTFEPSGRPAARSFHIACFRDQ
jgi:hypothetical protein